MYFLTDKIYPEWSIFAKPLTDPGSEIMKNYNRMQEGRRKDVERAFGILKGKFHILSLPSRLWYQVE